MAKPIRKYSPFGEPLQDIQLNVIEKNENVLQMQFFASHDNFKNVMIWKSLLDVNSLHFSSLVSIFIKSEFNIIWTIIR